MGEQSFPDTYVGRAGLPEHWPEPLRPNALADMDHPTPFLMCDLETVRMRYRAFTWAMPEIQTHYAVKCNPSPEIITTLAEMGSRFEVASIGELDAIMALGVRAADVLYSNPVKPTAHIAAAHAAGLWRFAADGECEIEKIARLAPGAAVYLRTHVDDSASLFPLSRKFGVDTDQAFELMLLARDLGLQPYGLTFHVGSQCTTTRSFRRAITVMGRLMKRLMQVGITVQMINVSGGFPARYLDPVPSIEEIGLSITDSLRQLLPYEPHLLAAEPGRYLVAESSVMVSTIIGRETRDGNNWLYLDVGAYHGLLEPKQTSMEWRYPMWSSRPDHTSAPTIPYTITGPTCDSTDTVFFDVALPATLDVDDRLYIASTGAYTLSYATWFNGFPPPTPLFINDDDLAGDFR